MPLTLEHVSYTYAPGAPHRVQALEDVSVTLADGEFVGVMGRTGCGKSTLLQLIAGLLAPTAGRVLLDGEDIWDKHYDRSRLRRRVGMVFQHPEHQLFETTVQKDVAFGLRHFGWSKAQVESAVKDALETVGFDYDSVKDQSPLGFSGGEKRRIAIAGVLAAKPGILLLDEPVAGLDPLGRDAFLRLLRKLNGQGVTVLMVSHNADALAECAQRILILKDGALFLDAPTEQAFENWALLQDSGVGPGQVRAIAELLRRQGWDIPASTVRYGELLRRLTEGRGAP